MSTSLHLALSSGHEHHIPDIDADDAEEIQRRVVAHLAANETYPTLDLGEGTVVRTDQIVLCRVTADRPRTGFVPRADAG